MGTLQEAVRWLADGSNWQGPDGLPVRVLQHLEVSVVAILIALRGVALRLHQTWGR